MGLTGCHRYQPRTHANSRLGSEAGGTGKALIPTHQQQMTKVALMCGSIPAR